MHDFERDGFEERAAADAKFLIVLCALVIVVILVAAMAFG